MRILAVNPNTTEAVTTRFLNEARLAAPPGVQIDGVTGSSGAAIVTTAAENRFAERSVMDLLQRHTNGYDSIILAISFDTALEAARKAAPVPVVGITRAMLEAACATGGRVGLVTFGSVSLSLYKEMISRYGMNHLIAGIEVVEVSGLSAYLCECQDEAVLAAAKRLSRGGAGSVAVGGAAIVGIARRLAPKLDLPIFDGAAPAVAAAIRLASLH